MLRFGTLNIVFSCLYACNCMRSLRRPRSLDPSSCWGQSFRKFSLEKDSNRKAIPSFPTPYDFFLDKHSAKLSRKQTKIKTRMMGEGGLGGAG